MKIFGFYIILLLSFCWSTNYAQKANSSKATAYFHLAEKEFQDQRYTYAIPFYKAAIQYKLPADSLAMAHLAESFWRVKGYDSAQKYYLLFEQKFGPGFISGQRLSEIYASLQRYQDAAKICERLLHNYPTQYATWVSSRLEGFKNPDLFFKDSSAVTIHLLKLNTKQQDFSPQYFKGGMVFVSNRYTKSNAEKEFGWDGLPFANIFWVKDTSELFFTDTLPARSVTGSYNISIKANDDYTARTSNDNDIIIASSLKSGYTGGDVHRLPKFTEDLNAKYNYGPLCFNNSGTKVYFTRNTLKAYKGRYNLEICEATLLNNNWTNVKVLPFVEPDYDFYHPAISADQKKLFFCSNRPGGKGGSDIYYVDLSSDSTMKTLIALDDKINTAGDELFPTIQGDTLYFSSDGLPGLGGLDIYKTTAVRNSWKTPVNLGYPINSPYDDFGIIINTEKEKGLFTSNRLGSDDIFAFENAGANLFNLTGTVLDKSTMRRLPGAKVVIIETVNNKISKDSLITDITGNFRFPIKSNHSYQLEYSKQAYTDDSGIIAKSSIVKDIELKPVLLAPIPKPVVVVAPAPKPAPVPKDTDGDGVEDSVDKCPTVKGTKENFGCPDIQARLNELAKMVFFKTARAELQPEALKPLNEVVDILMQYPNTTLAIEGHTDNRAGAAYNKDLSQRRANSVKAYLMAKGLKNNRFTSVVGYGLERPIADNNTDEGRQMNRRVSIKATFVY